MAQISGDNHGLRLAVRYTVLGLIALIFVFPLVFMLMSSLKPDAQLLSDTRSLRAFLPVGDISLDNYFDAFRRAPVGLFIFNSVIVTGVTVALSLLICSAAAFAFVFIDWRGRDLVLALILATLIVPFETIAIPLLLIASKLPWLGLEGLTYGWLNSYQVQIIPFVADGLTIFLFVQYFKDLPGDLSDDHDFILSLDFCQIGSDQRAVRRCSRCGGCSRRRSRRPTGSRSPHPWRGRCRGW